MKFLLSCVNSLVSFVGYDLAARQAFWYCPADRLRACGAAYDGDGLLIASDNTLTRMGADGSITRVSPPGPHDNLLHSVHCLEGIGVGLMDTGNSRLLVYGDLNSPPISFEPLEGWENIPADAIHMNDFVRTPRGIVASCFNYRPYRTVAAPGRVWQKMGYGLLLSLEKDDKRNVGRVLAGGLSCPHSLVWHKDRLYCCASATGDFLGFAYNAHGLLVEEERIHITDDHFLRGALPLDDGSWLLGGSHIRTDQSTGMALYHLHKNGGIEALHVAAAGEIYDILPWNGAVMGPVSAAMRQLPPLFADGEQAFPPVCDPVA